MPRGEGGFDAAFAKSLWPLVVFLFGLTDRFIRRLLNGE